MKTWHVEIIKREGEDPYPDLSYLGEYVEDTLDLKYEDDPDCVIDRYPGHEEWMGRTRECRYFVANVPLLSINRKTGKPYSRRTKQRWARRQYERMEAYNRGDWACVHLFVEAIISSEQDERLCWTRTGGLWGVESDSGSDYYESIWAEEMAEIRELLTGIMEFNLAPEEIEDAIQNAKGV